MMLKRIIKYILHLVLIGLVAFLYGFSNTRNSELPIISINIRDFEKSSYINKTML